MPIAAIFDEAEAYDGVGEVRRVLVFPCADC